MNLEHFVQDPALAQLDQLIVEEIPELGVLGDGYCHIEFGRLVHVIFRDGVVVEEGDGTTESQGLRIGLDSSPDCQIRFQDGIAIACGWEKLDVSETKLAD